MTHQAILIRCIHKQIADSGGPLPFFAEMMGERRDAFLQHLWRWACRACSEAPLFQLEDVNFQSFKGADNLSGFPTLLITMPTPSLDYEPYFVVIVFKSKHSAPSEEFAFLMLEKRGEGTMLCSLTTDGTRQEFGFGTAVNASQFLAAAEKFI